jgi:hypothetical protein
MSICGFVMRSLAALTLLAAAGVALAQQPKEPVIGLKAGEEMPFFVVDFVMGQHKDHAGCPSVMTSNARAKSVILLARQADESTLKLAAALEAGSVDGKSLLAFLAVAQGAGQDLAKSSDKAGLKKFHAGVTRDQSWQRLKELGLNDEIAVGVVLLDRKAVQLAYLLKAGELTDEKEKEIVAALESLAAKEPPKM